MDATLPKVALVTGAALRIGRAIALDLAEAGFAVALHHHRSVAEAETLAREIEAKGGRALPIAADLGEEDAATGLLPRVTEALGPVGVLVNSASIFERDEAMTVTAQSWERHLAVNLRAPFVLIQALARTLPPAAEAVAINIVDQRVWNLTPHFISYTLSKAGLWTLTQTLALALAPQIRVNAIGPGPVLASARQSAPQFEAQVARLPLGRGPSPGDIAAAVRFLIAQRAVTGQLIALDGGQHLDWGPAVSSPTPEE